MSSNRLRTGFTTGTCAAAAAKAAAVWRFLGLETEQAEILTPKGIKAVLPVEKRLLDGKIWFRVRKDAGDDPDVTDGAWVYARVELSKDKNGRRQAVGQEEKGGSEPAWYADARYPGIFLTGGSGIGIVTKPGLACPVGMYAINPVPRAMIMEAVRDVIRQAEHSGKLPAGTEEEKACLIRIQIPEGMKLAGNTFNPRLGIEGGISVLGTSGIVEPMSEQALLDTIRLEIHMKAAAGQKNLILTPGNYGEKFVRDSLGLSLEYGVKCSNFLADAIEWAAGENFDGILLAGHVGKLIKAAGGVRNTHSRYGDRRMEIMAQCLKESVPEAGKSLEEQILACNTTEEALEKLREEGLDKAVMKEAARRVRQYALRWAEDARKGPPPRIEVILFSSALGLAGQTDGCGELMKGFL